MQHDPQNPQGPESPQDPQSPQPYQPAPGTPYSGAPIGMPPVPTPRRSFGDTMRRRVAVPVWAVATAGLLLVCMLCGLFSQAAGHSGTGGTTSGQSANVGAPAATNTSGPMATPRPTATATHTPKWTTAHTFKGNGNKKSNSFDVPDSWRIVWSCTPSSFYGGQYNLIVGVYDTSGNPVDYGAVNTICKSGNTRDSTEEHQGGTVYLDVQSEAAWTIQVQVLK
ncbi:MAG TPA: hypothetical protein VFU88_19620 [Ktedonobacterales bacterium]|nr:hypothetical protein [Ktedonobacterales bacterium]